MKQFDILGFGAVAVDEFLYVDEFPEPEAKIRVRRRLRQCGGQTGTALVAAARLGAKTAYVGVIGEDNLSRDVLNGLQDEGVNTDYSVHRPEAKPVHATIVVDQTQLTRTIFASVQGLLGADLELPDPELIQSARVLLVDHHGIDGTLRAARIGRDASIPVVADFERAIEGYAFEQLMQIVDHLVIPEHLALRLTGVCETADAAVALWSPDREAVVITCGGDGGWYVGKEEPGRAVSYPAFSVDVVDTTGCGDVFHGAYATALAEGKTLQERITLSAAAAALKAQQHGGQQGIPNRETVDAFLQKLG
jgi:sulfofructose kinase